MKKLAHLLSIVLGTSMFVACDDSTSADNSGDYTVKVDTVYSVSKDTVFVMEKDTVVLNNRDTVVLNQRDTVVRLDTVVRMDSVVLDKKDTLVLSHADTVVLNHRDTVVVIDTVLGLNDDHCSVNNDFGTKALIVCGEDSTWVSKVMCGLQPYNPMEQFCVENQLYDMCGEKTYDPELYVCSPEKKVLPLCGTNGYDPETQFCFSYSGFYNVLKKCNGVSFVPREGYKCSENEELLIQRTDYRVIQLDTLLWMADNLKDEVSDARTYCGGATGGRDLEHDFIDGNCETYGRLYQPSVITTLGNVVCPDSWRLPTMEELSTWIGSVIEMSWKEAEFPGYVVLTPGYLRASEESFLIYSNTVNDDNRPYGAFYKDGNWGLENIDPYTYGSIRCVKNVKYTSDGLLM